MKKSLKIKQLEKRIMNIDSIEKAVLWFTLTNDKRFIKGYSDDQVKKVYEDMGLKNELNN